MIYCYLKGGLGNMLFQIFTTKSFAYDRGIDCSFPNLHNLLDYLNNEKNYNPNLNHAKEYLKFLTVFKDINTISPKNKLPVFTFPFEYVDIDLPKTDFIIDGFFQSERYFVHNRERILDWWEVSPETKKNISDKYGNLIDKKITSIHVRRGDYTKLQSHHFLQPYDYYKSAINILRDDTEIFIVSSDDIEWCKKNFEGTEFYFVENEKDYYEIILISLCKNNIISNSSFSWWGAWLNKNKNKKVVAPKNWFGPALQSLKTDDIIPENWIKI